MHLPSLCGLLLSFTFAPLWAAVRVEAVPEGGLQPEVAVTENGTIHLVYLRGDPKAADVRYTSRQPGQPWQASKTVNSIVGSAIAIGSIRGPQLAIGAGSSVHVLWNGVAATPAGRAPLWYAHLAKEGAAFAAQQDLLGNTTSLDGGASIATNRKGEVWIAWHGNPAQKAAEESQRVVFLRTSQDDGILFGAPEILNASAPGVCACCSLRVQASAEGRPVILYRNVSEGQHRAMSLLSQEADTWRAQEIETWQVAACPMSSATLQVAGSKLVGAWETAGKINAGWMDHLATPPVTLASRNAKHPTMSSDGAGNLLVAWVEGTGWSRGGDAGWVELDANLKSKTTPGRATGVPIWGRVAVYAEGRGQFVLLK